MEMAPGIIFSNLVSNQSQLLVNEVKFRRRVEEQVLPLRSELQNMKNFLKKFEVKCDQHNYVMVLVDQIRNITHEIEDIVDTFVVDAAKEKRRNKALNLFRGFNNRTTMLHNVEERITQVKTKIEEIYENRDYYQIQYEGVKGADQKLQRSDLKLKTKIIEIYENRDKYQIQHEDVKEADQKLQRHDLPQKHRIQVEEDDVVGFVEEARKLANQLVKGTEELDVLSISGMGGLGKTTISRKVYNDSFVQDCFTCRAWVSVSQNFKLKELLMEILKDVTQTIDEISEIKATQTTAEISEMTEKQLKQELHEQLSHHRYLVVLDDLWSIQHWDELKEVFPNNKIGSRVFVTTRNKEVAFHATGNPPLELRFLNDTEGWELFTKKVFRQKPCPTDLETFGKKIVANCGGLPLAIVVLGGLLASREKTYHTWKCMAGNANWLIAQETLFLNTLGLSYYDLPPYLKPCFIYLGLFPEGYKIPARQVIQLWISEGFIEHDDNKTTRKEDVAEKYLQHLIDRSLIQVEERRLDGGVKTCRVHDLTRDLCLQLSKDEKFLESHNCVPSEQTEPRRLSIHCSRWDYISSSEPSNTCSVRTLLCFNQENQELSVEDWKSLFKSFKLLKVLDLGERKVHSLPKAIDKLVLLKYLRVKAVENLRVPSSIFALDNLQTLDLRRSRIDVLPEEIWGMQQLRHLYLNGSSRLPKNTGKKCLSNLQTLCYVSKDPTGRMRIAANAPNLRKLGLYDYWCNSSDEEDFTFNLPYLESLKFVNECIFDVLIELPPTITKISIKSPYLQPETIEIFRRLPGLRILKLDGPSFCDNKLVFGEGWFPKLQVLKIENSSIKRWELRPKAAVNLKRVVINNCPRLNTVPKSLTDTIGNFRRSEVEVVIEPARP